MSDVERDDAGRTSKDIGGAALRALGDDTRRTVIDLLTERPATVSELAATIGKAKGTIAHHIDVLVEVGLVEVVSTRKVRAVEERTYGRTADIFWLDSDTAEHLGERWMVADAVEHARPQREGEHGLTSVRFARIPHDRAKEFADRLTELARDFTEGESSGDTVYGLLIGLFPTDRPHLPDPEDP
ncbi:MAG: helix-turn-helix domain-containing protein [Actinomycetota bacterium]